MRDVRDVSPKVCVSPLRSITHIEVFGAGHSRASSNARIGVILLYELVQQHEMRDQVIVAH
ncbi:unannotated protein [freshwater metagenome]|uniref:Unannotated protein n=1 Tax=freshwater metagenome TaxID=449393 RepID=A0A6J6MVC9_9ZZZZ